MGNRTLLRAARGVPLNLPVDFHGPRMRRGLTQAGYGGPFVLRSNPFGGIIDAVRGFCLPVPMEEGDTGGYSDLTGEGLGTPGADFPIAVGGPGGQYLPQIVGGGMSPMQACGAGSVWDGLQMQCVPDMAMTEIGGLPVAPTQPPVGAYAELQEAGRRLQMAVANCDVTGIEQIRLQAGINAKIGTEGTRGQWKALFNEAAQQKAAARKRCAQPRQTAVKALGAGSGPDARARLQTARKRAVVASPLTLTEGSGPRMTASRRPLLGAFDPGGFRR